MQVPTPDVRRSSLSSYERRCQLLKRLQSSTSVSPADDEHPSPSQSTVVEETVHLHFIDDKHRRRIGQRQTRGKQEEVQNTGGEDEEDIDAIVEEYKRQMSKL